MPGVESLSFGRVKEIQSNIVKVCTANEKVASMMLSDGFRCDLLAEWEYRERTGGSKLTDAQRELLMQLNAMDDYDEYDISSSVMFSMDMLGNQLCADEIHDSRHTLKVYWGVELAIKNPFKLLRSSIPLVPPYNNEWMFSVVAKEFGTFLRCKVFREVIDGYATRFVNSALGHIHMVKGDMTYTVYAPQGIRSCSGNDFPDFSERIMKEVNNFGAPVKEIFVFIKDTNGLDGSWKNRLTCRKNFDDGEFTLTFY